MIAAIITRLDQLEHDSKIRELNNYADECDEQMYYMGQQLNQLDQYIRRENVTLSGISDQIPDEELEGNIIEVLGSIDVHVNSKGIVACHRLAKSKKEKLKKGPSKVIVRFVNRKNAISCLKNKKKLREENNKSKEIFINEQVCPAYQKIFDECLSYKHEWSFNGIINIKFTDDRTEKPKKVFSLGDLYDSVDKFHSTKYILTCTFLLMNRLLLYY